MFELQESNKVSGMILALPLRAHGDGGHVDTGYTALPMWSLFPNSESHY